MKKVSVVSTSILIATAIACGVSEKSSEVSSDKPMSDSTIQSELADPNNQRIDASNHTPIVILESKKDFESVAQKLKDPAYREQLKEVEMSVGKDGWGSGVIRNLLNVPTKILYWNHKVASGTLNKKDQIRLRSYIADEDLKDVAVSINKYEPGKVFQRTFSNEDTGIVTKIVFGTLNGLAYTFSFPKITGAGGDRYDPYANMIILYSDDVNYAMNQVSSAKDYKKRPWKFLGFDHNVFYSFLQNVFPIAGLYHQSVAAGHTAERVEETEGSKAQYETARILAPILGIGLGVVINDGFKYLDGNTRKYLSLAKAHKRGVDIDLDEFARLGKSVRNRQFAVFAATLVGAHIVGRIYGAKKANDQKKKLEGWE